MGIGIYLLSLIIVSLCFRNQALKPLWMAWGIGAVLFFFLLSYVFNQRWQHDNSRVFSKKVFWTAFAIRLIYVVAILFYYYWQTGISLEYNAADSMGYHQWAVYLSTLLKEGQFRQGFHELNAQTMGFSDQGYILYLTGLYTLDKNILVPRLLKALMSAFTCIFIYRLAQRNLGEKAGKLAAVMAVFLPQFLHYNGTYLKETEMLFVATFALERMDYLLHSKRFTFWNIFIPILLTAMAFGFRTIIGMLLILSFVVGVWAKKKEELNTKTRWIVTGTVVAIGLLFLFTPIGREMLIILKVNVKESGYLVEKYRQLGMKYAEFANWKWLAPGAFVLPISNLVEVANDTQKMMNGAYFIKNFMAFFAMWSIVVAFRDRQWRNLGLIGSFTLGYILLMAFSFAVMSERYQLPAMPGILMLAAFAMQRFRKKDFPFFYVYCALLLMAIVGWNYLKISARGLF